MGAPISQEQRIYCSMTKGKVLFLVYPHMNIWKIIYGVESYPGLRGETGLGKLVPPH